MTPPDRRALAFFGARFLVVFAVSLLPLPWLPGAYVTVAAGATNAVLWSTDWVTPYRVRLAMPDRIERDSSWKAVLLLDDREQGDHVQFKLDMRSFSYHPVATYVALAAASSLHSMRRRLALWAGGLVSMFLVTTAFAALPLLSRFAVAGAFGDLPGRLVRTAYQATATPVMVYALPVLIWWLWMLATRPSPPAPLVVEMSQKDQEPLV